MRTLKLSLLVLILSNQGMLNAMEAPSEDIATALASETATESIVPDALEDIAAFATLIIVASIIAYSGEKEEIERTNNKDDDSDKSGCTIL